MPEVVIDLIIIVIVLAVLAGCVFFLVKQTKSGAKCIGCPYAKTCGKSSCDCSSNH